MDLELARQQWRDGSRRAREAQGSPALDARLQAEVEVVSAELRRRLGLTFTLAELAEAYANADDWVRAALDEAAPEDAAPRESAVAADAAFDLYARGAKDYTP